MKQKLSIGILCLVSALILITCNTAGTYLGIDNAFIIVDKTTGNLLDQKYIEVSGSSGTVSVSYKNAARIQMKGTSLRAKLYKNDGLGDVYVGDHNFTNFKIDVYKNATDLTPIYTKPPFTVKFNEGGNATVYWQ